MTAIKRLIADCLSYHSRSSVNPNGSAEVKLISQEVRNTKDTCNYNHFNNVTPTVNNIGMDQTYGNRRLAHPTSRADNLKIRANLNDMQVSNPMVNTTPISIPNANIVNNTMNHSKRNNVNIGTQNIVNSPHLGLTALQKCYTSLPLIKTIYTVG